MSATAPTHTHEYVTLGRSGLRVHPICLGAMTFGTEWGFGTDPAASEAMLTRYLEWGGNFIDTANIYTKGHSERILGDYFRTGPGRGQRDRAVIATKFGGNMWPGDPNGGGSGIKAMFQAVDASLRRLQTDAIDLLWCHFWDRHTPIEELVRGMDDLVRAGKVRYLGLSDHPAWVCALAQSIARMRGGSPFVALQIEYSLLQRTVEGELIPMALHEGMGVTPWSPLRGGVLSGKFSRANPPKDDGTTRVRSDSKFLHERTYALLDAMHAMAARKGCSVAQLALRWTMDRPGVASTIIGARTMAQLEDNLGAAALRMDHAEHAELDALTKPELPFPCEFLDFVRTGIQNGTTINGVRSDAWPMSPQRGETHFTEPR
ncbi:MAG: aldo/keto reductase [Phycisphaerales bacterium]